MSSSESASGESAQWTNDLYPLILGAPFGNYLRFPWCSSTLGTYTYEYRGGFWKRVWRVARTVRYYHSMQAWKNKLGLPNPGLNDLRRRIADGRHMQLSHTDILSLSAKHDPAWETLLGTAHDDLHAKHVEMNVSCPNCPGEKDYTNYSKMLSLGVALFGTRLIVKLPPVGYESMVTLALDAGVRSFHCCNTLPTPGGGLSGKPLKALSLQAVRHVKARAADFAVPLKYLIGGGGITSFEDMVEYSQAGATNFAIASVLFKPWKWKELKIAGQRVLNKQHLVPAS